MSVMRLRANRSRWSRNIFLSICFGAPTQWAKLRSPLAAISAAVVLVAPVGCVSNWSVVDSFLLVARAGSPRPTDRFRRS